MIGYQTVGTNKFKEAAAFYDALLGEIGAKRMMEEDGVLILWASAPDNPMFCIHVPENGKTATIGNGSMTGFIVDSPELVDKLYAQAIALGASDEGLPGPRGDSGFYAGYCRDLDGNKFNFFCMTAPKA